VKTNYNVTADRAVAWKNINNDFNINLSYHWIGKYIAGSVLNNF